MSLEYDWDAAAEPVCPLCGTITQQSPLGSACRVCFPEWFQDRAVPGLD